MADDVLRTANAKTTPRVPLAMGSVTALPVTRGSTVTSSATLAHPGPTAASTVTVRSGGLATLLRGHASE